MVMLRCRSLIALLALLFASRGMFGADSTLITLGNPWFEAGIDAERGGRISSLVFHDDSGQWVQPGEVSGLLLDHVTQQDWPGELLSRTYEVRMEEETDDASAVCLWTTIDGKGDEDISGVRLEKVIRVYKQRPLIEVLYSLENPTTKTKRPGLWVQNVICPAGRNEGKTTYRPTSRGVLRSEYSLDMPMDNAIDFRFDPTAGWLAVLDEATRRGLVFYMDYNWLKCLYCNMGANTQEWWYDTISLPAGKTFETTIRIWPISGLRSVQYADERIVASTDITRTDKHVSATLGLVDGPDGGEGADVKMDLEHDPAAGPPASVSGTMYPARRPTPVMQVSGDGIAPEADVLLRVEMAGAGGKREFEVFDAGVEILFVANSYRVARPRKMRHIFKPEQMLKKVNDKVRVLLLKGLFSHYNRWPQVVACLDGELIESRYGRGTFGSALSTFPKTYDELLSYDVIVMDAVPADAIDADVEEFLGDFVSHGGVLLVLGGEILAVAEERVPDDLLALPFSTLLNVRTLDKALPLDPSRPDAGTFRYGLDIDSGTAQSSVIATSGTYPVLVSRRVEKGVTAVFCPVNLGDSQDLSPYWTAPGYPAWMADHVKKLLADTVTYGDRL